MHILQIGLPKSGNFWLYSIIDKIINEAHLKKKSFIKNQPIYDIAKTWDLAVKEQVDINMLNIHDETAFYHISSIFKYPIDNLDDYINNCTHVWSHSWFRNLTKEVCNKFDKTVYIIRDPRDVAISLSKFVFTPIVKKTSPFLTSGEVNSENFLEHRIKFIISDWAKHILGYLHNYQKLDIYIIFYERLLHNFDEELKNLLTYFNLELSEASLNRIKTNVSLTIMKKDNPNHIRKGLNKQWIQVLTPKQKEDCLSIAKPLLELLKYPINEQFNTLPQLPQNLTQEIFDNIYQNLNLMPENQFKNL